MQYRELSFTLRFPILHYFVALLLFAGSAYLALLPNATIGQHFMAFVLPVTGLLYINWFRRKKVIIEQDKIISITSFKKRQLYFYEVEGIRIDENAIALISNSPHKNDFYIHDYKQLKDSKQLVGLLNDTFEIIEKVKFEQGVENYGYDNSYGFTPAQRQTNIERYNKAASLINIIGGIFAIAVFIPLPIFKAIAMVLPPLCMLLVVVTKNRLKLSSKYGPVAYPILGVVFIVPILTLFIKSFLSYDLYSLDNLWLPSLALGGVLSVIYYLVNIPDLPEIKKGSEIIPMALLCFAYSFATVRLANCEFDSSAGVVYKPSVVKKEHVQTQGIHGTDNKWILVLSEWGEEKESGQFKVDKKLYERTKVGENIQIKINPGLLNIPWINVSK